MSIEHNIWNGPNDGLPEEKLAAYLDGTLSEAERWEVEQWLSGEGAESDALEGLSTISADEAMGAKARINARLQQSIGRKRSRRKYLNNQREAITAVLVVLLIIAVCFGIMWVMKHGVLKNNRRAGSADTSLIK